MRVRNVWSFKTCCSNVEQVHRGLASESPVIVPASALQQRRFKQQLRQSWGTEDLKRHGFSVFAFQLIEAVDRGLAQKAAAVGGIDHSAVQRRDDVLAGIAALEFCRTVRAISSGVTSCI